MTLSHACMAAWIAALASVGSARAMPPEPSPSPPPIAESSTGLSVLLERWAFVGDESAAPVPGATEAFSALLDALPDQRPSGFPLGEIALLGVVGSNDPVGWLQAWLWPRTPRLARIEEDLLAALQARRPGAITISPGGRTGDAANLLSFSPDRGQVAAANSGLGVDALLAVQVSQTLDWPSSLVLEARLYGGRSEAGTFEYGSRVELPGGTTGYGVWNPRAIAIACAGLAALLVSRRRRGGVVIVDVSAEESAGHVVFTAYVFRGRKRDESDTGKPLTKKRVHPGKNELKRLPTQELRIGVRRVERSRDDHQVVRNDLIERVVQVGRQDPVSLSFAFDEQATIVEVELTLGKQAPALGAASLGVQGSPESARYLRDGKGSLPLRPGSHTLLIGYEDRAFRVPVRIQKQVREIQVKLDVGQIDKAFFSGCVTAVPAFVGGDLAGAASALEAAGLTGPAALLWADVHRAKGDSTAAARVLESAGQLHEAARVRASSGDAAGTAMLLERAEDWRGAARQHKNAGDLPAAARAFARGRHWDEALECAFASGDREIAIEVLSAKSDFMQAARLCLELDDGERAIVLLQRVSLSDPAYGETCLLLAEMFNARSEPELALQKLDEAVDVFGSEASLELREQIALQLERKGNVALALECYEHIRKRDFNYPGAADKIDALRTRLSPTSGAGSATRVAAAPASALSTAEPSRYELEAEIGRGGMGVVFRARDTVLGRVVAYKRLPENLKQHKQAVKFFMREARSAAALNHPNIVTLYDAGQEGDVYYLTMELLEGRSVDTLLEKLGRLDVRNALKIAIQVAEGLEYAHDQNIVHRDIKPSNLFVTRSNRVKIMDFGLAKMVEEVRRKTTLIAGTPHYMAPEQAIGDSVEQSADLYAFGVTIYELICGEVPFPSGDATYHRIHTPAPDLRETLPEVPATLAGLVVELMAKRPESRPSASEAVTRLKAILRALE